MDLTEKLAALASGEELPVETMDAQVPETENLELANTETQETPTEIEAQSEAELSLETPAAVENEIAEKWEPSLKYKVLNDEHEFPEWTKNFVNSKEVEEQFVDLLTRANALDHQKKRRGEIEDQYATLQTTYDSKMEDARSLAQLVSDHNTRIASNNPSEQLIALQNSGLSEKAVLDIARHVLDLQKLDPSQRQAHDMQFTQRDQINQYEQQLNQTQATLREAQQHAAQAKLTSFLSTKSDMIKEYEAREGNGEGEFQEDFINFGVALQNKLGKEIEWKDAFKQFKKSHGLGRVKSKPAPKTLPNLRSSGHSPVEKDFKNMDDLRKHMNSSF